MKLPNENDPQLNQTKNKKIHIYFHAHKLT
jgi:hypothetical protein